MPRIIAGEWGGRTIVVPPGHGVRPTTDRMREAWMSALDPVLADAFVLDLFAGSGALGLECLSRGARFAVFVERSRSALNALRTNIRALGAEKRCRVVQAEVFRFLEADIDPEDVGGTDLRSAAPGPYDLALADPPYDRGLAARILQRFHERPFASELWLEHSRVEPMPDIAVDRRRRYGDSLLTTVLAPRDPVGFDSSDSNPLSEE